MIKITNLVKEYNGKKVLDNINLEIKNGEILSIIGDSGCGKTTFLKCLMGLEEITSGAIEVDRKEIGMVFQSFNLFPNKTALENIMEPLILVEKYSKDDARKKALEILKQFNLDDKKDLYPKYLSGGQKQRVAIGRALTRNPKYLILDEPTSALDPKMVKAVFEIIRELKRKGMTIIIVSHEIDFVENISTRIIEFAEGKIKKERTLFEV